MTRRTSRPACEAELDFHYIIRGIYLSGRMHNRDGRSLFLFNDQARGEVACLSSSYFQSSTRGGTFRHLSLIVILSLEQVDHLVHPSAAANDYDCSLADIHDCFRLSIIRDSGIGKRLRKKGNVGCCCCLPFGFQDLVLRFRERCDL